MARTGADAVFSAPPRGLDGACAFASLCVWIIRALIAFATFSASGGENVTTRSPLSGVAHVRS